MPARTRFANWMLRFVAGRSRTDEVVRELDEEFRVFVVPERGIFRARIWFWGQVLRSLAPTHRAPTPVAPHRAGWRKFWTPSRWTCGMPRGVS